MFGVKDETRKADTRDPTLWGTLLVSRWYKEKQEPIASALSKMAGNRL